MNGKKNLSKGFFLLICLLLIVIVIYSGFRFLETTVFLKQKEEPAENSYVSKTIERDGISYFPNQNIETFLVIGTDKTGPMEQTEYYENSGMADTLAVLIFDKESKKVNVLSLNRDTMTDIPVLSLDGRPVGTTYAQIAASYTYGDGLERSCENTVKAVSTLLGNVDIDHYIAMTMDGISVLNDAVGGVTVDVKEDFSAVDPTIKMGEMTLSGEQALMYVRGRKDVGNQLNVSRMERQQEYMESFFKTMKEKINEDTASEFAMSTFEEIAPYMVTDCSVTLLSTMMERYADYELGTITIPEGKNTKGEKYMEFYLDEEALDKMVIDLFYAEKR